MKLRLFLLLLTVCLLAISGEENQVLRQPINWKPIVGYKNSKSKAFVDVNGFDKTKTANGNYVSGALLLVASDPQTIKVGDKSVTVKSVVKHIIIDCSSRFMVPVMDFYFDIEKPNRLILPVAGFEYPTEIEGAELLSKSSAIYQAFCPVYI